MRTTQCAVCEPTDPKAFRRVELITWPGYRRAGSANCPSAMRDKRGWLVLGAVAMVALSTAMGWFWNRSKKGSWEPGSRTPPWGNKPSIYAHISHHLRPDTKGLSDDGERLPDEKPDDQIRFAPGMMDGVLGGSGADASQKVTRLHRAITK